MGSRSNGFDPFSLEGAVPQSIHTRQTRGFVTLMGAGPGAPDLLTVRALKALQEADVILPDALLEPGFEALYPKGAVVIPVGKRCGKDSTPQEEIHALLIRHARVGKRVVRLKGGDPLLYGRGGEEAQALAEAGIPYAFIPGVSALFGAASATGIPLTHRGVSRELRVLEGHHLMEDPATDWKGLATGAATLAIYMGTRSLQGVARQLLSHGADPELPVALVERAQCEGETLTLSTLRLASEGHLCCHTEGPGLVLMGEVVRSRVSFHPVEHSHGTAAPLSRSLEPARPAGGRRDRRAG